jgi:hypothetical protein
MVIEVQPAIVNRFQRFFGRRLHAPQTTQHSPHRRHLRYTLVNLVTSWGDIQHTETLGRLIGQRIHALGTHLRRDTVIPQWFQASKAAAASDGHAAHC